MSLGLERAGMRTVAFCERDEFCRAVLRKHWPDIPCFDDIHTIDAGGLGGLGRIDLVSAGFPCQPFSVAGKRAAHADDRYLWPQVRQVVALSGCTWFLGENVAGIISVALDTVLSDLESDGFATRTFVIPACAKGARHRRDRVWFIAYRDGGQLRDQSRGGRGANREGAAESRDAGAAGPASDPRRTGPQIGLMHPGVPGGAGRHDHGQNTALDNGWSAESPVVRRLHGIPARVERIRALGNAVYPPLVEEIGRAIMQVADPGYNLGLDDGIPGHSLGLPNVNSTSSQVTSPAGDAT